MNSLYLHIPFCSQRCHYCDFFSSVGTKEQRANYGDLLLAHLPILRHAHPEQGSFSTIYFGGGTPSLLSVKQIADVLNRIEAVFGIDDDAEITLEANPGTVTLDTLKGFRRAGLNRLSLGLQSFDDGNLITLGRCHSSSDSIACVEMARDAGFANLSLDLIFALPHQTRGDLENDVTQILNLDPEHISIYGLTIEEGTELERKVQRGDLTPCDEDLYADLYRQIHDHLTLSGYEHYEISNFARPGQRCRHNQGYWQRKTCLALGTGAHGFDASGWGRRWHIPPSLTDYAAQIKGGRNPEELLETFDREQAMKEYVYLALRTRDGLCEEQFRQLFHESVDALFENALGQVSPHLQRKGGRLFFDLDGWLIYDHLISSFL